MLRTNDRGYEPGKRSSQILKAKRWLDSEFCVVDITASADGWAILHCANPFGPTFKVSAPGTIQQKTEVLNNKDLYIGRCVTVEYADLTKDRVPFHPVALNWR